MMRSALTVADSTMGTFLSKRSSCKPARSMASKLGPLISMPMGARIPLCNMTSRAAIGCNFGAEVEPGIWPA